MFKGCQRKFSIEDLFSQIDVETKFLTTIYIYIYYIRVQLLYSLAVALLTTFFRAYTFTLILHFCKYSNRHLLFYSTSDLWDTNGSNESCDFIEDSSLWFVNGRTSQIMIEKKNVRAESRAPTSIRRKYNFLLKEHRTAMGREKVDRHMRKGEIFLITIMLFTYFLSI